MNIIKREGNKRVRRIERINEETRQSEWEIEMERERRSEKKREIEWDRERGNKKKKQCYAP